MYFSSFFVLVIFLLLQLSLSFHSFSRLPGSTFNTRTYSTRRSIALPRIPTKSIQSPSKFQLFSKKELVGDDSELEDLFSDSVTHENDLNAEEVDKLTNLHLSSTKSSQFNELLVTKQQSPDSSSSNKRLIDEYLLHSPYKFSQNERNSLLKSLDKIKSLLDNEEILAQPSKSSHLLTQEEQKEREELLELAQSTTNYVLVYEFKTLSLLESLDTIVKEHLDYMKFNQMKLKDHMTFLHSQVVQRPKVLLDDSNDISFSDKSESQLEKGVVLILTVPASYSLDVLKNYLDDFLKNDPYVLADYVENIKLISLKNPDEIHELTSIIHEK